MRNDLEIPPQLAVVRIQRDYRIGEQIVAFPHGPVPIRRWIARAPDDQVLLRIERTGHPSGTAPVLPSVTRPGFITLLAGPGNCPKPPAAFPALDVVSIQKATNPIFTTRDSSYHHVFHDQGRRSDAVAGAIIGQLHIPPPHS